MHKGGAVVDCGEYNYLQVISPWARDMLAQAGIVFETPGDVAVIDALRVCVATLDLHERNEDDAGDQPVRLVVE